MSQDRFDTPDVEQEKVQERHDLNAFVRDHYHRMDGDARSKMEKIKPWAREYINAYDDVRGVALNFDDESLSVLMASQNKVVRKAAELYDPRVYTPEECDRPEEADVVVVEFDTLEQAKQIRRCVKSQFKNHACFSAVVALHEAAGSDIAGRFDDVDHNVKSRTFALAL